MSTASKRTHSVLLIAVFAATSFLGTVARAPEADATTSAEKKILYYINKSRDAARVRRLWMNESVAYLARKHSAAMASRRTIFHSSNLSYTLRSFSWRVAGENVGMGPSLWGLHVAFMKSPSHRANILRYAYRSAGVGIVWRNGIYYVTVMFLG